MSPLEQGEGRHQGKADTQGKADIQCSSRPNITPAEATGVPSHRLIGLDPSKSLARTFFSGLLDTTASCGIVSTSVVANSNAGSPRGAALALIILVRQLLCGQFERRPATAQAARDVVRP